MGKIDKVTVKVGKPAPWYARFSFAARAAYKPPPMPSPWAGLPIDFNLNPDLYGPTGTIYFTGDLPDDYKAWLKSFQEATGIPITEVAVPEEVGVQLDTFFQAADPAPAPTSNDWVRWLLNGYQFLTTALSAAKDAIISFLMWFNTAVVTPFISLAAPVIQWARGTMEWLTPKINQIISATNQIDDWITNSILWKIRNLEMLYKSGVENALDGIGLDSGIARKYLEDKADGAFNRNIKPTADKLNAYAQKYDSFRLWLDKTLFDPIEGVVNQVSRVRAIAFEIKKVTDVAFDAPAILSDLSIRETFTRKSDITWEALFGGLKDGVPDEDKRYFESLNVMPWEEWMLQAMTEGVEGDWGSMHTLIANELDWIRTISGSRGVTVTWDAEKKRQEDFLEKYVEATPPAGL